MSTATMPRANVEKLRLSKETLESFGKANTILMESPTTYSALCSTSCAHTRTCAGSCTIGCSDCGMTCATE